MRYSPTDRIGVNAIERIVIEDLEWIFREQPIVDVGIDAMIEIVNEGNPTGRFIAAQIKSGQGNFHSTDKSLTYYASDIHYQYWTNCNLPVILIGYLFEDKSACWEVLSEDKFKRTKRQWKIEIHKKQQLSFKSKNRLLALVGFQNRDEVSPLQTVSIEYILAKKEELKNIHQSKVHIEELTSYLSDIKEESENFNLKIKDLTHKRIGINDARSKAVFKAFANKINLSSQDMERSINSFSDKFAVGSLAFHIILKYCKEFHLFDVLEEAKQSLKSYPVSVDTAINQIKGLKSTVDNFSKINRELKQATIIYSEVLALIIREFLVAKNTVEKIIEYIDE